MPSLSLRLLGGFEAILDGSPIPPIGKKAQALLAYLALEGRSQHSRNDLGALLWGNTGDEQAQQSLRKALSALRQALGRHADLLIVQEGAVGLDRARTEIDAIEFERRAREKDPAALAEAISLYRGPCLAGLDIDEEPFNEWLTAKRERLRQIALSALDRFLEHQESAHRADAVIETASRLLELEPLHEPAHRALIRIYGSQGRRAAAARQYQLCVELLERELGVTPEPATETAYRESLEAEPVRPRETLAIPPTSDGPSQQAVVSPKNDSLMPRSDLTAPTARPPSVNRSRSRMTLVILILGLAGLSLTIAWLWLRSASRPPEPAPAPSQTTGRAATPTPSPRRSIAILAMRNLSNRTSKNPRRKGVRP